MNTTARTLALVVVLLFSGCASIGKRADDARIVIQKALDAVLPPTFEGDSFFSTRITYVAVQIKVTIRAGGLKRTESGWVWSWLSYAGESPFSATTLVFGAPPNTLLP